MRRILLTLFLIPTSLVWAGDELCVRNMEVPEYPVLARAARIEGTVRVGVEIGRDGRVLSSKAESGHALLRQAAEQNVRGWIFKVSKDLEQAAAKVTVVFVYNIEGKQVPVDEPICPIVILRSPMHVEIKVRPTPVQTSSTDQN